MFTLLEEEITHLISLMQLKVFLLQHRHEDAGILQYTCFPRKIKQEKGKRKHMAPKNLKP